ncbi:MAG: type II toxin-antitoxin system HicB family antitoxin, partial [Sulfuricaulis sp.]|nr:type II toxin-antitoxin system HicB family antitoxin [Sulfuricaulis sp.]
RMQLFVVHIDHHAPHHDRPQLPVQTQTPLESRPPLRLIPHWTTLTLCVPERNAYNPQPEVPMKYRIALHKSEEGYSVSVPGLPGCWSQGATEQEAMENIRDAIREYLSVVNEQLRGEDVREIEVAV